MRIGRHTNGLTCEVEMQKCFNEWLEKRQDLEFIDELRVPEVGRVADFIIWKTGNGLINVEAKGNVNSTLYHQAKDHATYCSYSFVFIPDYTLTPKWFKKKLTEKGWGLIVFNYDTKTITEVLEAHVNKGIDNKLQNIVKTRMRGEIIKRHAAQVKDTQRELDL